MRDDIMMKKKKAREANNSINSLKIGRNNRRANAMNTSEHENSNANKDSF